MCIVGFWALEIGPAVLCITLSSRRTNFGLFNNILKRFSQVNFRAFSSGDVQARANESKNAVEEHAVCPTAKCYSFVFVSEETFCNVCLVGFRALEIGLAAVVCIPCWFLGADDRAMAFPYAPGSMNRPLDASNCPSSKECSL